MVIPFLLSIWYPAENTNVQTMQLKDYFQFAENENTNIFSKAIQQYQYKNPRLYAVKQNIDEESFNDNLSLIKTKKEKVFKQHISTPKTDNNCLSFYFYHDKNERLLTFKGVERTFEKLRF